MAACLLGLQLAGCSRHVPPSPALTSTAPTASTSANADTADKANGHAGKGTKKEAEAPALAYAKADNACRQQASKTTMGSILAIFTRLRPGAYDANYKACMKGHGYDLSQ